MADQGARPPVLLRGATVLVMDDAKTVLTDADVLTQDDRIAAVGPQPRRARGHRRDRRRPAAS